MEPNISYKILPINECKAFKKGGAVYLEGYANTKNHPDRYGDVPTVFSKLRDYCYDVSEYQKNPVMLIDHQRTIDHVAGSMESLKEDERGLKFMAKFSNSDHPTVKHCREIYEEGHAKALSISGRFYFEDGDNPTHLTLAKIYEVSCVPVGADPDALGAAVSKALKDFKEAPKAAGQPADRLAQIFKALQRLESGEQLSADELRLMRPFADELRMKMYGTMEVHDPEYFLRELDAAAK